MHPAETRAASAEGTVSIASRGLEPGILIAVTGEIDLATAPIVEDELRRAEGSEDVIVLDLGGVTFMDSSGIRIVIAAELRQRERGASLRLAHVPPQVARLFDLAGIAEHLEITPD